MHPGYCPNWEYANYPNRVQVLQQEAQKILLSLRNGNLDIIKNVTDTREIHSKLFYRLTPPGYNYYAGRYRGEDENCLKHMQVGIPGTDVGYHPLVVLDSMDILKSSMMTGFSQLDRVFDSDKEENEKLLYLVKFACDIFVQFLKIHPYVNGNGHIGRFIVIAILGKYGYWMSIWNIEPRPLDPPYTEYIVRYRQGDIDPLMTYMLRSLE
jgi:fido (protein-threonine AMPylation protein)